MSISTLFIPICLGGILFYALLATRNHSCSPDDAPHTQYTLVLGAGLKKSGQPTDILVDRVLTACELIEKEKTDFLIMSGTIRDGDYDEPKAMKKFALSRGLADSIILVDVEGTTTFRSCVNALNNLHPKKILIVTQHFHLPRALFIARSLGMDATGVPANVFQFSAPKKIFWAIRELLSIPINILRLCIYYLSDK
jgi:SanA protein